MKDSKKAYVLWNKLEEYSDEEFNFLKNYIRNQNFTIRYGFYNKISSKKKQIALIFDTMPSQMRRSGVENNWEIICTRQITEKEIEEYIIHYYRDSFKRFLVFYYKNVERLIQDDEALGTTTPNVFIDKCRKKGYTEQFQTMI